MQKVNNFVDDTGQLHAVAEDAMGDFQGAMQQQGRGYEPTTIYMGDGEDDVFHVPQSDEGRYAAVAAKEGRAPAERLRYVATVDGQMHAVGESGQKDFIQAYRTAPEFQADREAVAGGIQKQGDEAQAAAGQRVAATVRQGDQAEADQMGVAGLTMRSMGNMEARQASGVMKALAAGAGAVGLKGKAAWLRGGAESLDQAVAERPKASGLKGLITDTLGQGLGFGGEMVLTGGLGGAAKMGLMFGLPAFGETYAAARKSGSNHAQAAAAAAISGLFNTFAGEITKKIPGLGTWMEKEGTGFLQTAIKQVVRNGSTMELMTAGNAAISAAVQQGMTPEAAKQAWGDIVKGQLPAIAATLGFSMVGLKGDLDRQRLAQLDPQMRELVKEAAERKEISDQALRDQVVGKGPNGLSRGVEQAVFEQAGMEHDERQIQAFVDDYNARKRASDADDAMEKEHQESGVSEFVQDVKARKQAAEANREPLPNRAERRAAIEQGMKGAEEGNLTDPNDPNKAARIMDILEKRGVVGPLPGDGTRPREILKKGEEVKNVEASTQAAAMEKPIAGGEQPAGEDGAGATPTTEAAGQGAGEGVLKDLFGADLKPALQSDLVAPMDGAPKFYEANLAVDRVKLSKDVPNFKKGANEKGVVRPLGGKAIRDGLAPIIVWERKNGDMEVITGRHRLDLFKRNGEKTIPAHVFREADGYTQEMAFTTDAFSNIKDEKGGIKDYAQFLKGRKVTRAEAEENGLLAVEPGRLAFSITDGGTDDLYTSFIEGDISAKAAAAIAEAAPKNQGAQLALIGFARKHTVAEVQQYAKAMLSTKPTDEQLDMFGTDTSWQQQAEKRAAAAGKIMRAMEDERATLGHAKALTGKKRIEYVKKYKLGTGDEKTIAARLDELDMQIAKFQSWYMDPELTRQVATAAGEMVGKESVTPLTKGTGLTEETKATPVDYEAHAVVVLDGGTPEQIAAEKARVEAQQKAREEREKLEQRAAAPLAGGGESEIAQASIPGMESAAEKEQLPLAVPASPGGYAGQGVGGKPGEIHGEGGSARGKPGKGERDATAVREAETPNPVKEQAEKLQAVVLKGMQKPRIFKWFTKYFGAHLADETARFTATVLQATHGEAARWYEQAGKALAEFKKHFDNIRDVDVDRWVYDPKKPLPRMIEVQRAIDGGEMDKLTDTEKKFAVAMRSVLDAAIARLHDVKPELLTKLYEDYFARNWKAGAGMSEDEAATIRQNMLARYPLEGNKGFLKQRKATFMEAIEKGLVPAKDNPVDMTLDKVAEIYKFIAATKTKEELKAAGLWKFHGVFEGKIPAGWRMVEQVFGPPDLTTSEAVDFHLWDSGKKFLEWMGVDQERLAKIPGHPSWWGSAQDGGNVRTRANGDVGVLWHEIGHILDFRYRFYENLVKNAVGVGKSGQVTQKASQEMRGVLEREFRALADMRERGGNPGAGRKAYLHKEEEKMANMVEGFVRMPETMREQTPNLWRVLNEHIELHPELARLRDVRPGVAREVMDTTHKLPGFPLIGYRIMPENAAQVMDNWTLPNRLSGTMHFFQKLSSLENQSQLMGFFHGQMVLNDTISSGMGFAINDLLSGRWGKLPGDLVNIPALPVKTWFLGRRIGKAYLDPAMATEQDRVIATSLQQSNMRTDGLDYNDNVREFKRAFMLAKNTGSGHAVVDAFLKAPMAVAQAAMWPVMKLLVPNMKRGVFAMEMRRMIENNPGMSEAEMRKAAQTAAANTENRLGQVTYQNLHQNNTVKAAMQLALRAYGWQATKYRMAFDAAGDWAKAGKALARGEKPELTYGMTYLPALVMTHAVIAASIQAALTGEWPEELKDYLFPKSGLKDRYGQDVRLSMADFLKDYVADFRSFPDPRKMTTEWTRKLSPMWNMAAEMYNDKDFYGDEIFSAKEIDEPYAAHLRKNLGEASHYLLTKSEPFSVRGGAKMRDEYGAGPVLSLAPYVGLVPAPSYATKTPAQIKASEVMQSQRPQGARTAPEKQRADELAAVQKVMREAIRTGAISTAGQEELAKNIGAVKTQAQMATIMQKLNVSPLQYQIMHMQRSRDAMMVWDLADAKEKKEIYPLVLRKVYQGMRNDPEAGQRYLKILQNTAPGTTTAK